MFLIDESKVVSIALTKSIPDEKVKQIRSLVKMGISRYVVAKFLKVSPKSVYRYTFDLPKKKMVYVDQIPKDQKRKIRSLIKNGESKLSASKEFNLTQNAVYKISKDIKTTRGDHGIRGFTLKLLKHITQDGFYIPKTQTETVYANQSYKRLKRDFPKIIKLVTPAHSIYLSDDRREEAFTEFMNMRFNKSLTYRRYLKLRKFFGLKLTPKQKKELSERW
jgi:hypothetical protein